MIRAGLVIGLVLLVLSGSGRLAGAADTEFRFAYPDAAPKGPAAAKGAAIYNHGKDRLGEPFADLPFYADGLREAGWDVYQLIRQRAGDRQYDSRQALIAQAKALRAQGYRRVVTLGQSFGAWISFDAGAEAGVFDAIVATAPAAEGERGQSDRWRENGPLLYALARNLVPIPTMVFLFEDDAYDPGGRGETLTAIFQERAIPFALVDRPAWHVSHGAARTRPFARAFGPCIVAFVDTPMPAQPFACVPAPIDPVRALDTFRLPKDLAPLAAAPAGSPEGLGPLVGRWYGWYDGGREAFFTLESIVGDRVRAVYGWASSSRSDKDQPGGYRIDGRFDSETGLLRLENERVTIEVAAQGENAIRLAWRRKESDTPVKARLRRID